MVKKVILPIGICLIVAILFQGCSNNNKQDILGSICDTTDTKFSTFINPVIIGKCVSCHNNSSQSGGVNLEGYDQVKNNYDEIIRTMKDGTMPKGSARIDQCTISKIQTWVNRGALNN